MTVVTRLHRRQSRLDANGRQCGRVEPKVDGQWQFDDWRPLASRRIVTPVTRAGYGFESPMTTRQTYPLPIAFLAVTMRISGGVPWLVTPIPIATRLGVTSAHFSAIQVEAI